MHTFALSLSSILRQRYDQHTKLIGFSHLINRSKSSCPHGIGRLSDTFKKKADLNCFLSLKLKSTLKEMQKSWRRKVLVPLNIELMLCFCFPSLHNVLQEALPWPSPVGFKACGGWITRVFPMQGFIFITKGSGSQHLNYAPTLVLGYWCTPGWALCLHQLISAGSSSLVGRGTWRTCCLEGLSLGSGGGSEKITSGHLPPKSVQSNIFSARLCFYIYSNHGYKQDGEKSRHQFGGGVR